MEKKGVDLEEKKDEYKKKKSVAFKASSSSKNKGKSKKEESSEDEDASDIDDGKIHEEEGLWCKDEKRLQHGVCEKMLQV